MTGLRLSARTTSCGVVGLRPICLGMTSGVSRDVFVGGRVRKNAALSLCILIFCSSILPVTCFWLPGFNRALGGGGGSSTLTFPESESPVRLTRGGSRTVLQNVLRRRFGDACDEAAERFIDFFLRRCSRSVFLGDPRGGAAFQRSSIEPNTTSVRRRWVAARHLVWAIVKS